MCANVKMKEFKGSKLEEKHDANFSHDFEIFHENPKIYEAFH